MYLSDFSKRSGRRFLIPANCDSRSLGGQSPRNAGTEWKVELLKSCQLLEGIFLIRIFVAPSNSVFVRDVQGNGLIVKLDIMFYIS